MRARGASAYMRHQFEFYGLSLGQVTASWRAASAGLPKPAEEDVLAFADACWERPQREWQYAGTRELVRHVQLLSPAALPRLERLLTTRAWWDTVDELSVLVVGKLVLAHPELQRVMDEWIDSPHLWLARTAILHQERWRERTDRRRLFRYCRRRAADRDFFIRKAIGWALRSYAGTEPEAVAAFVAEHEAELSGLSRREAMRGVERALTRRTANTTIPL